MIDLIKRFFGDTPPGGDAATDHAKQDEVTLAVCALLLEMGRIDDAFTTQEMQRVLSILKDKYGLSGTHADALMEKADHELDQSVDLWQFARVINQHYSVAEKEALIERLWQVVYVDGKMNSHEHYLMNKLSNLLRLSHKQLIDAKLKVLHGNPADPN